MRTLFILSIFITQFCFAQNKSITLDSCVKMAKEHYPLIKQNQLIEDTKENNIQSIQRELLPRLNLISQASFQSEVTEFNLPGFKMPAFPKDQYFSSLQLEQTIFDGGLVKQEKTIEKLSAENEKQKNEIELYKIVDRVNAIYSSILLSKANRNILEIYAENINNKKGNLHIALKNGLVLQSSLDELEAEALKTDQSIDEIQINLDALYASLSFLTGNSINKNTELLTLPIGGDLETMVINRAEIKWFDTQKNLLDARQALTNKTSIPKLSVFGEGNYGRPGYNFLDQNMRAFGKAGILLKWNISSLYKLGKEEQKLNINKKMIDLQKEVFEFNLKTTMNTQLAQINALKSNIEKDKIIIEKRQNIKKTAASQLDNGVITSTEYLVQLNAEMQAVLNQKVHEIKLMNAITTFHTTQGITNF